MLQAMRQLARVPARASLAQCNSCGKLYLSLAPPPSTRGILQVANAAPDFSSPGKPPQRRKPLNEGSSTLRSSTASAARSAPRPRKLEGSKNNGSTHASGKQRLSKVMAAAGVAARRPSEELIAQGAVSVNGQVVLSQVLVDPEKDVIHVNGKKIDTSSVGRKFYYFAVNKPKGYICSNAQTPEKREGTRAVDLLQPWLDAWVKQPTNKGQLPPRFFTVGRLDVATTGLLFVTNDGQWANDVIHPSADLSKEYLLLVDRAPSKVQLEEMMRGVEIDGVRVAPMEVATLEESVRLRMVVKEGKKHEGSTSQGTQSYSYSGSDGSMNSSSSRARNGPGGLGAARSEHYTIAASTGDTSCTSDITHLEIPRYDSSRLLVTLNGVTMWVWDLAAWQLSLAMVDKNHQPNQPPAALVDPITGNVWHHQRQAFRPKGRYRGGEPKRRPVARRWQNQPLIVLPPSVPNLRTPAEWEVVRRAQVVPLQGPKRSMMGKRGTAACWDGVDAGGWGLQHAQQHGSVGLGWHRRMVWNRAQGERGDDHEEGKGGVVYTDGPERQLRPWVGLDPYSWQGGMAAGRDEMHQDHACLSETDWKVRLIAASAGLEVLSLKRVRVGGYRLPRTLRLGEYIALTPAEVKRVSDSRAQQSVAYKQPSEQRQAPKLSLHNKDGTPNPEAIAALLEPGSGSGSGGADRGVGGGRGSGVGRGAGRGRGGGRSSVGASRGEPRPYRG